MRDAFDHPGLVELLFIGEGDLGRHRDVSGGVVCKVWMLFL